MLWQKNIFNNFMEKQVEFKAAILSKERLDEKKFIKQMFDKILLLICLNSSACEVRTHCQLWQIVILWREKYPDIYDDVDSYHSLANSSTRCTDNCLSDFPGSHSIRQTLLDVLQGLSSGEIENNIDEVIRYVNDRLQKEEGNA